MALLEFNAEGKEGIKEFQPLNPGEYSAMIMESELKPNTDGKGNHLSLTFELIEGPFKGSKVFDRLNLQHDDAAHDEKKRKMVEIAQRALTSICQAVEKLQIKDSSELHAIPLNIKVKMVPETIGKDKDGNPKPYPAKNEIANYFPYKNVVSQGQPAQATASTPAAPAVPAAPPWDVK